MAFMASPTISELVFNRADLSNDTLQYLYRALIFPRLIEEKMLLLLRQGKISKWFSGIGQEAISVGATAALEADEYIFTLHRNLGVFTTRQVPLERLFAQWQAKPLGYTKGRDRSFHFGAPKHHIIGMISHLGPQLSLAAGVGLAHRLDGTAKVALAFSGEGGTSEGEFHEALNTAAVWQLPVIFLIENNGYGLSTPTSQQYRCAKLADRGIGYGMRALTIDGNNILDVFQTVRQLAEELRQHPEPVLLECQTFRRRGHEEASGTKYVPEELMAYWEARDPISNYEAWLLAEGLLLPDMVPQQKQEIKLAIEEGLQRAAASEPVVPQVDTELGDVFAPAIHYPVPSGTQRRQMRFVDAITDGLHEAMRRHTNLVLMGQDIADYGGVFKVTEGFAAAYGNERVRNTPLCESAIIGIGLGLSITGRKSMVEMQFGDFVSCGFNQIVNNLAKLHYRWGQTADVVIRLPTGGGVGAGPFHSQSTEAWFFHVPGLRILYPSSPAEAKGLLLASFEDPNPVLFFEHKALYRSLSEMVPEGYYTLPINQANLVRSGNHFTIITYGMGVKWAKEATERLAASADIVDLRSLQPIDWETIAASVRKTNRVLILHEDTLTGGIGGEISAYLSEHLFEYLDAPIVRVASLDTPVPFNPDLERQFLASNRLQSAIKRLLEY